MKKMILKIKTVFAAWKLMRQANKEVTVDGAKKPGYKTTEFWGKVLIQAVVVINAFKGSDIDPEAAMKAVLAIEAVYVFGRSLVKAFSK